MSTIHLHGTTTSTPEQYVAGLTDFGPGRSKLFGNSADEYLKVHERGRTQADVTEGSGGIWERLHYDWSDPAHVVLTTTDSNTWGGASGHTRPASPATRLRKIATLSSPITHLNTENEILCDFCTAEFCHASRSAKKEEKEMSKHIAAIAMAVLAVVAVVALGILPLGAKAPASLAG